MTGVRTSEFESEGGDPEREFAPVMTGDWTTDGGREERSRRKPRLEENGKGVTAPPGVAGTLAAGGVRWRASEAARRRRLVVPRALVDPERAEHTMASLC